MLAHHPPGDTKQKKQPGPGFEKRPKNYPPPPPKKKKPRTGPLLCKKKQEKKGGVVESTLAFVLAFVLLCTVLMIKTRFFACGIRSLLTRELVYGSMQGITTLLARRTSSSLSILAFGLMLIGVVHVLRLPAYGPMYIVFRLLPLMIVWVLLFWCCLAFFGFACLAACAGTFTCLLPRRLRSPCRARLQKKKKGSFVNVCHDMRWTFFMICGVKGVET